jgi:hypothetical protein
MGLMLSSVIDTGMSTLLAFAFIFVLVHTLLETSASFSPAASFRRR